MITTRYYPQIDGLRAVAVIPVMITHCWTSLKFGGGIGVDLFFVISGFVITNVLMEEFDKTGTISLKNFYVRRIRRLLPALVAVCFVASLFIILLTLLAPALGGLHKLATIGLALTSTMNWARAFELTSGGILGHTWSLSVEEQFYLVWPLILSLALQQRVQKSRILMSVIFVILCICIWRFTLLWHGATFDRVYHGTDTRIDQILTGCALSLSSVRSNYNFLSRLWLAPVLVFLLSMIFPWQRDLILNSLLSFIFSWPRDLILSQVVYSTITLSCAWLVILAKDETVSQWRILVSSMVLWIGKRSYSLYLWHYPIMSGLHFLGVYSWQMDTVAFVASFFIADISYRFVEKRFLPSK